MKYKGADSLELSRGKADLWNSGKTKSCASVMIPYQGKDSEITPVMLLACTCGQ